MQVSSLLKVLIVASFLPGNTVMVAATLLALGLLMEKGAEKYVGLYLALLLMALVSGVAQEAFFFKGYLLSFITLSSLAFYFIVKKLVERSPYGEQRIESVLLLHVYLSIFQLPLQLIQLFLAYGFSLSVFAADASAGDIAYGSLGHSSFLADKAVLSLFLIQALSHRIPSPGRLLYSALVLMSLLIVGSNHTLVAAFLALAMGLIFSGSLSFRHLLLKSRYLLVAAICITFYANVFEQQMQIVQSSVNIALDKLVELPRIKNYIDTLYIFYNEPILALLGLGMGSYSSRASFILSGTYLWEGAHPLLGTQMSKFFEMNLLPLWNLEMRENVHVLGTIFQPFSWYATILAEYGLVAFVAVMVILGKLLFLSKHVDIYARSALAFFIVMCFIDNFVEYPNIAMPFIAYLTYAYSLKRTKTELTHVTSSSDSGVT